MTTPRTGADWGPNDLVTIQQAATLVGVSRRTIYNWMHAGKLTVVRTVSGRIRIVRAELLREQVVEPAAGESVAAPTAESIQA